VPHKRWTIRTAAVDSVFKNYGPILTALDEVSNETSSPDSRAKARGLYTQFSSSQLYWSLCVSKIVFSLIEKLSSTTLQKSTTAVAGALAAVQITNDALMTARNDATFDDIMQQVAVAQLANDLDPLSTSTTKKT